MNKNDTNEVIESLKTFRQDLYDSFPGRADANMDLLDSLSANQTARSVVERSLSVEVVDSGYCHAKYLHETGGFANHVVIARSPNNRVFYRQPTPPTAPACGHPTWYGEPFRLADPATWGMPETCTVRMGQTKKGRALRIECRRWNSLLMRGTRACPMQHAPY